MYVYIYIYMYVYIYIHPNTYIACICIYIYIFTCTYIYVCNQTSTIAHIAGAVGQSSRINAYRHATSRNAFFK